VGIIDGFVYLGTAVQSYALGWIATRNWAWWPLFLLPFGAIGFLLLTRIWHAKPGARTH
jgi:OPA family glycerol-3-phosphate transporter-like MFS transporter